MAWVQQVTNGKRRRKKMHCHGNKRMHWHRNSKKIITDLLLLFTVLFLAQFQFNTAKADEKVYAVEILAEAFKCVSKPIVLLNNVKEIRSARYIGDDSIFKVRIEKHQVDIGDLASDIIDLEIVNEISMPFAAIDEITTKDARVTISCRNSLKCITDYILFNPNSKDICPRLGDANCSKSMKTEVHANLKFTNFRLCDAETADFVDKAATALSRN
jgi:hypothetical protein